MPDDSLRSRAWREKPGPRYWWHHLPGADYVPPIYSELSEAEWTTLREWYEETDQDGPIGECAVPLISFLHGLPDTMYSKIGVLGLSMGATAAVLAASRTSDILALVAESCPVDATRVPGDVPDEASREADRQLVEDVYGVDITQARPIDDVNKFAGRTAIFFINGDADDITPLPGMQALYQAASAPKQYWVVPNAGHAQSFAIDPDGYMQRADAFFDTYLH